jgi:hypothetical protein
MILIKPLTDLEDPSGEFMCDECLLSINQILKIESMDFELMSHKFKGQALSKITMCTGEIFYTYEPISEFYSLITHERD